MKTDLNAKQCRELADKWLMLSRRSEGWMRLVRAMAELTGYPPAANFGAATTAVVHRDLLHALTEGNVRKINELNLIVITRRLTGE